MNPETEKQIQYGRNGFNVKWPEDRAAIVIQSTAGLRRHALSRDAAHARACFSREKRAPTTTLRNAHSMYTTIKIIPAWRTYNSK